MEFPSRRPETHISESICRLLQLFLSFTLLFCGFLFNAHAIMTIQLLSYTVVLMQRCSLEEAHLSHAKQKSILWLFEGIFLPLVSSKCLNGPKMDQWWWGLWFTLIPSWNYQVLTVSFDFHQSEKQAPSILISFSFIQNLVCWFNISFNNRKSLLHLNSNFSCSRTTRKSNFLK